MKWFALRFNSIRSGDHSRLDITHSVNKVKKQIQKNLSPERMTQSHLNLYFQSIWPPGVTATVRILKRGLRSQGRVSLARRPSSQVLGIFRMFCFCFGSDCQLTMIWKHLFFLVLWSRIPREKPLLGGSSEGKCECTGRSGREGKRENVFPWRRDEKGPQRRGEENICGEMLSN